MQWLSTSDFVRLLQNHYPATAVKVREWCEAGHIPPEFVKRSITPTGRGRWYIASRGMPMILAKVLNLSPGEINEIMQQKV